MAKRDRISLGGGISVETGPDWNGRYFVACRNGASVFIRDPAQLRAFLKLPAKTPSREALDSWLVSLDAIDQQGGEAVA